ncbi:hypothetical protein TKK_0012543 [Trichogramma kaykai]
MVLREMMAHLETRFADFFEIENAGKEAALAALMRPKFKASWMYLLEETEQSKVLSLLHSLIRDEEEIVEEPEPMSQDDDFFEFDPMEGQRLIQSHFNPQKEEENEVMRFMNEKSQQLDILNNYPKAKKLFIQYNTVLPSSVPVEQLFSYVTLQDLPKFNRTSDEQFEKRELYKVNLSSKFL